jgi:hypothetical protein
MAGAGIQSLAKFCTQMCAADCGNPQRLERRLPRIQKPSRGLPQTEVWIWERIATGLTWPWQPERGTWQSAVHLRAVCQEVIPVVAIRGIWPRNLPNYQIPAPDILHRQFPCLFLTRDFLGVRQICGGLFRPKLYTNGLSWQNISWYYPFKEYLDRIKLFFRRIVHNLHAISHRQGVAEQYVLGNTKSGILYM